MKPIIGKAHTKRFTMGETVYLDLHTFAVIHKPLAKVPPKPGKTRKGWVSAVVAVAIDQRTGVITYKTIKRRVSHARG
jgi:hypothetical protein